MESGSTEVVDGLEAAVYIDRSGGQAGGRTVYQQEMVAGISNKKAGQDLN